MSHHPEWQHHSQSYQERTANIPQKPETSIDRLDLLFQSLNTLARLLASPHQHKTLLGPHSINLLPE